MRLIGYAIDIYDGATPAPPRGSQGLKSPASLLALCGYSFFFAGVSVGPQLSYALFTQFVNNSLMKSTQGRTTAGLQKLALGIFYTIAIALAMNALPIEAVFTTDFQQVP